LLFFSFAPFNNRIATQLSVLVKVSELRLSQIFLTNPCSVCVLEFL
jgi:hypothetical protein